MSGDVEQKFLAAIADNTHDIVARSVYADWLDEHGDPRGEYLRLEATLHVGTPRLAELAAQLDPAWIMAVTRLWDVVLLDSGPNKIFTIKAVRAATGFGLKDAKDLVDATIPKHVRTAVTYGEALETVAYFDRTGAQVTMTPHAAERMPTLSARSRLVLLRFDLEQRIDAVIAIREVTGLALVEAQALVDAVARGEPRTVLDDAAIELVFAAVIRLRPTCDVEIQRLRR